MLSEVVFNTRPLLALLAAPVPLALTALMVKV
jgi:hypothetical protein